MPSVAKAAAVEESGGDSVPWEFTEEAVEASREGAFTPYEKEMKANNSLNATFLINNPWLEVPQPGSELSFGEFYPEGSEFEGYPKKYYDTLPMDEHPYYKDLDYPKPTKDIQRLRHDLFDWGFCLIEDAMSPAQAERFRLRVEAQAAGERASGTAYTSGSFQIVWSLINKGRVFEQIMNHDPEAVQAGPLIERLVTETIGGGWTNLNGGAANIAFPGCHPQGLHQDQAASGWTTPNAPTMLNSMYVLQDVDHMNGGTLFIPGSHKIIEKAVMEGKPLGKLPPSCNLKAKAGTVMLFEGRVLHGTGANRSDAWRYVATLAMVKPWLRQQENTMLGLRPEVLDRSSEKLMQRLGYKSQGSMHMEGYGMMGSGRPGDTRGDLRRVRQLIDKGEYQRMGPLKADGSPMEEGPENPEGWRVPNDELSLHILQGPDGEGEGRVQARQFAENMEASIGGGGFVDGDVKAGKSKL